MALKIIKAKEMSFVKYFIINDNPYEFDLDENGMLALTKKNVDFMNGIIKTDSSYRFAMDENNSKSSCYFIKKYGISRDPKIVEEQVRRINKENSTHLASSGTTPGSNQGIKYTVETIRKITTLKEDLSNGNPDLVNKISVAIPNRNIFSFVSKFCTFVSRYAFEDERKDNYCIYDNVLNNILPYYAWIYLGESYKKRKNSSIRAEFVEIPDYGGYRELIDKIRNKSYEKTGYQISRKDFDSLLWYYYKGVDLLNKKERALELVGID